MKKLFARIYLVIILLTGILVLGLVFFREPTVHAAFQAFEGAYQAGFRKGVVLFLIALIPLMSVSALVVLIRSHLKTEWFERLFLRLEDLLHRRGWFLGIAAFLLLGAFIAGQLSLPADYVEDPLQRTLLNVSRPVFLYGFFLFISLSGWILFLKGNSKCCLQPHFLGAAAIFLLLSGTGYILHRLGYGLVREPGIETHFDFTGNPLLGYQVLLALIGSGLFVILQKIYQGQMDKEEGQLPWGLFDGLTVIFIFLLAVLLWNSSPLQPHSFVDQPRPPNYEFYPDSDALLYDRAAQSLLARGQLQSSLGEDKLYLALRPGLTFYQAVLHAVGGLGYEDILPFQLFFFAFWPVLIYLLTSLAHQRISGFLAALLIIIRVLNGQVMGEIDAGAHARLLVSEIPMIMGLLLILIVFQIWKNGNWKNSALPLMAGGLIGWTMLIRLEVILIVPIAGAVVFIWIFPRIKEVLPGFILLTFGLLLVISPWIFRNWQLTGDFYLNRPDNRMKSLRNSFQRLKEEIKGETITPWYEGQYLSREVDLRQSASAARPGHLAAAALPVVVAKQDDGGHLMEGELEVSFLDHFSNNLIQSMVFLPSNPLCLNVDFLSKAAVGKVDRYYGGIFYSPEKYVKSLPYWSGGWDGSIAAQSLILVFFNLVIISRGAYALWRQDKFVFWILGGTYFGYLSLYSFVHRSGGRLLQISDWVIIIIYSVGLIEIISQFLTRGKQPRENLSEGQPENRLDPGLFSPPSSKSFIALLALGFLFLGSLPVLSEAVMPNRFPVEEMEAKTQNLLEIESSPFSDQEVATLTGFLDNGGEVVWGRGLYPRQFFTGESTLETKYYFYGSMERVSYARFEYFSAGTANLWSVIKRERVPEVFPHGSSVLSIGCSRRGNLDVLVAVLYTEADQVEHIYWRDGNFELFAGCPLTP